MLQKLWNTAMLQSRKLLSRLKTLSLPSRLKNLPLLQQTKTIGKRLSVLFVPPFEGDTATGQVKRSVWRKGVLAGLALVLTLVMLFAMTAAWYSNVIQSAGLVFEASSWGLDGSVNIQSELTTAAPGKSGEIALTVNNTSDGLIAVSLNVSKGDLYNETADMRKRLYFYIDDTVHRHGETTSRVYLNSVESYSYTVLSKQSLVLGENGNGAPLTWEWVYDVLGYYFYGTVNTVVSAQVSEYLRPVVYDFDSATFIDGRLETVDGQTTVAQFIEELSQKDGYAGTVTAANAVTDADGKVYYPVSVDDTGRGVWIYCCSLSEIEYENVVDTRLGNAADAANRSFQTYLNVLAQQKQLTVTAVNSVSQLSAALNDDTCNMVQLSGNVELTEAVTVSGTSEKILDLAGYTLSSELAGDLITVEEGASLTLMNGAITGNTANTSVALNVVGGDVAMSGMTVSQVADGIWIADQETSQNDSRVNITDCTIHCSDTGVFIKGNGPGTAADTCLTIENSTIISTGNYALLGNGSAVANGNWGTDIYVHNSTLEAKYTGIYHPQRDSTLLVEDCVVKGLTPFVVKGGEVTITDTEITAHADSSYAALVQAPAFSGSGFADTAAGLYVETNYNYPCRVTLTGENVVTSTHQVAILKYESDNALYTIQVTGGSYSHNVSAFVAEGYVCNEEENGRWVVSAAA